MDQYVQNWPGFIDDFVNGRGRFKGIRISKQQKYFYRKHNIVPMQFIYWLQEQGFYNAVRRFEHKNRSNRTVSAVVSYIQRAIFNQIPAQPPPDKVTIIRDMEADDTEVKDFLAIRRFEQMVRDVRDRLYSKPQNVWRRRNYDNRVVK